MVHINKVIMQQVQAQLNSFMYPVRYTEQCSAVLGCRLRKWDCEWGELRERQGMRGNRGNKLTFFIL